MDLPGGLPQQRSIPCTQCNDILNSSAALGRHHRRMHRSVMRNSDIADLSGNHDTAPEVLDDSDNDSDILYEQLTSGVADETFNFFERYGDVAVPLFEDEPALPFPLRELCPRARVLLRFCCSEQSTLGESRRQYELETFSLRTEDSCHCQTALRKQFRTAECFAVYLNRIRRLLVRSQGWYRAEIETVYGKNTSGAFRRIIPLVTSVIKNAGGYDSIEPYRQNEREGRRVYSNIADSDALRQYTTTSVSGTRVVCIDVYADGTQLAHCGSQSATPIRIRVSNVRGQENEWHEVGIAPLIPKQTSYTERTLGFERLKLLHRFLHLLFRDAILASRTGFMVDSRLVLLRVSSLVCDQKQERPFLCLKSVGSFMDCSMCQKPTRAINDPDDDNWEDVTDDVLNCSPEQVYAIQTNGAEGNSRNVVNTVFRQLMIAKYERDGVSTSEPIRKARRYLHRVSASKLPSVFSAFYGLGSKPFSLFNCIGLDRLHSLDLGLTRDIPDHAYRLFGTEAYNKGQISRSFLVRNANQRFKDLPPSAGISICPFRSSSNETHASMTGSIRRKTAPFLWVAVMGLQPLQRPDDDVLLQAALAVNQLQICLRGINQCSRKAERTVEDIDAVQKVGFRAGIYLSQALGLPINTKMHRIMHHIKHNLIRFGNARHGDSDMNETLHKATKQAYLGSNRRVLQLAPQILTMRTASLFSRNYNSSMPEQEIFEDEFSTELRYVLHLTSSEDDSQMQDRNTYEIPELEYVNTSASRMVIDDLARSMPRDNIDAAINVALSKREPTSHRSVWLQITKVKFNATFQWLGGAHSDKLDFRQIAYAGENVNGAGPRYDAVEYDHDGAVRCGIIHCNLQTSALDKRLTVVIVKRLRIVPPQPGNRKVVEEYGHTRYAYEKHLEVDADVVLDVVPLTSLRRVVVIVRDMFDVVVRLGRDIRMNEIVEDYDERCRARFFLVKGVQRTTFD